MAVHTHTHSARFSCGFGGKFCNKKRGKLLKWNIVGQQKKTKKRRRNPLPRYATWWSPRENHEALAGEVEKCTLPVGEEDVSMWYYLCTCSAFALCVYVCLYVFVCVRYWVGKVGNRKMWTLSYTWGEKKQKQTTKHLENETNKNGTSRKEGGRLGSGV